MKYELTQTYDGVTQLLGEMSLSECVVEAARLTFMWDGFASFACTLAGVWV